MQIKCRFCLHDFCLSMCVIREKEKDGKWREINREKLAEVLVSLGCERRCTVTAQSLSRNSELRRPKTLTPLFLYLSPFPPSYPGLEVI